MMVPAAAALLAELKTRFHLVTLPLQIGETHWTLVRPRSADELISEEDFAVDERLPYWAEVWPSSRILAEHLAGLQGSGKTLLELGGGIGLGALQGAAVGFRSLATDYYRDALQFTQLNAWLHGLDLRTQHVDWREFPPDLGTFDVVVAADVLYERAMSQLVAEAIKKSLAPKGQAWVTDPQRVIAQSFPGICRDVGLQVLSRTEHQTQHGKATVCVDCYALGHRQ